MLTFVSLIALLDGGVGEMTNLYNHQANKRVSAATMAFTPDEAHSLNRGGRNGHNPINVQ